MQSKGVKKRSDGSESTSKKKEKQKKEIKKKRKQIKINKGLSRKISLSLRCVRHAINNQPVARYIGSLLRVIIYMEYILKLQWLRANVTLADPRKLNGV